LKSGHHSATITLSRFGLGNRRLVLLHAERDVKVRRGLFLAHGALVA
jgi:hypothetical protein